MVGWGAPEADPFPRAAGAGSTLRSLQEVLSVPNEVAAELGALDDGILDALRDRFGCSIFLRGNRLTLEGRGGARGRRANGARGARRISSKAATRSGPGPSTPCSARSRRRPTSATSSRTSSGAIAARRSRPKTVNQKRYVDAIRSCTITFGIGPAGTGKTYLAMALAVAALSEREVGRIILTRPAVEAGEKPRLPPRRRAREGRSVPAPALRRAVRHARRRPARAYMEKGMIEVAPLAFMRGRTLNDSFVILDEAQNTSPEQMQMFLTRLGFGSQRRGHRRRDADRSPPPPVLGTDPRARDPRRRSTESPSSSSGTRTSCGTSSCSGSWRPTSATPRKPAPSAAARGRSAIDRQPTTPQLPINRLVLRPASSVMLRRANASRARQTTTDLTSILDTSWRGQRRVTTMGAGRREPVAPLCSRPPGRQTISATEHLERPR